MRQSARNNFQYNSPNSSDNRRGITYYRCGELGRIKADCKERVYCTTCRSPHHDTKACRKHRNNTPSPPNNHILTGYHPTATPPPLIGTTTGSQLTQQMSYRGEKKTMESEAMVFWQIFIAILLQEIG